MAPADDLSRLCIHSIIYHAAVIPYIEAAIDRNGLIREYGATNIYGVSAAVKGHCSRN